MRILHVVSGMVRAGLETWLMHTLRHIDRNQFQMDFLVNTTQKCAYDEEIHALGSRIIPCLDLSRPWQFASNFKRILKYGSYDIVHSHVHHFSGYTLHLAKQAGIPIRIAHSHVDSSSHEAKAGLKRQLYTALMKKWIADNSTAGLACSQDAAVDLFGSVWKTDRRWQLIYYGIDLNPFQKAIDVSTIRTELGIPSDAFVVGHVGRFEKQKNHNFLIEIAAEIVKQEPKMCLLLIGQGPLRPEIEQKVKHMGLADKVIFAGTRDDVPYLMQNIMNVFLFPSLYEGLPVVGLEAQAAGLPLIISDEISRELDQVELLIKRISLSQPASVWAKTVLAARNTRHNITQADCLSVIENSKFNIAHSVKELVRAYENSYS